jgi:hypothetical protein
MDTKRLRLVEHKQRMFINMALEKMDDIMDDNETKIADCLAECAELRQLIQEVQNKFQL